MDNIELVKDGYLDLKGYREKYPNSWEYYNINYSFNQIKVFTSRIYNAFWMDKYSTSYRLYKCFKNLVSMLWTKFRYHIGIPQKRLYLCSFGCGEGWKSLVDPVMELVDKTEGVHIHQVKEKFGGLRIYIGSGPEEVFNLIDAMEKESYKTCEYCGTKENVTSEGSWVKTLCGKCREKSNGSY